ncbi:hypothetical protein CF111_12755 [Aeromonas sobria]|uniref:glycosyltransferase family 4 protein n=1 Tax=Aeromonas sobria TaxID=646 RepID=UPI0011195A84|nr:glycosyltransferase family 4 protein [Aeromonas sobria]TNJ21949.1 hypothetical protein CF111_12755 [Aeromonas sobria]
MNICFILPSLAKKGPNIVAYDLISFGVENDLFDKVSVYFFNDYNGTCLDFQSLKNVRLCKIDLFSKVDLSAFDIVHSHMLKPDLFVFLFRVRSLPFCNQRKCKSVTTLHQKDYVNLKYDFNSKIKACFVSIFWRIILIAQTKIVCLSQSMLFYYKNKIMNQSLTFIYNGRGRASRRENKCLYSNHFNLGTSCLLTKRKGIEQVIKALPYLPFVTFQIAGSGPELENLKKLARDLNVGNQVEFLGFVEDTSLFLHHLDAFVLPSRGEGFPLALIEAASHGLPIVASNIDVVLEAFNDDEIAIFELDSIDSLLVAINKVYKNRDLYSQKIYKIYEREFTQKAMFEKYYAIYMEVSGLSAK